MKVVSLQNIKAFVSDTFLYYKLRGNGSNFIINYEVKHRIGASAREEGDEE